MSGTLLKQNQSLSFIPLQPNPIPALNRVGCSPTILPLSPVPIPLTVALWGFPQDHNEYNSSMARSQTNTARLEGLRPGMVYVVQVRARTVAGYGKYSGKMCFQTLTDGECGAPCANGIKGACVHTPLAQQAAWQQPADLRRRLITRQREEGSALYLPSSGLSLAVYFCLCCLELWGQKPLAPPVSMAWHDGVGEGL